MKELRSFIEMPLGLKGGIERFLIADRASWLKRREADVTASVAAALFNVHPFMSPYELWARKSGLLLDDGEETPAQRRGRLLEPVALQLLGEERPDWTIIAGKEYWRDPAHRIGATPDALATRPDIEGLGVVQVKTVGKFAFHKGWRGDDHEPEIPLYVAIQAHTEAALTGATWASVVALALGDGGLDLHILDVPLKPKLTARLRELVADFWRRVEENRPYEPDYAKDAALLMRVYAEDNGSEIDLSESNRAVEIVVRREQLKAIEAQGSVAEKERRSLDAEIINLLGNAARGRLANGSCIETKVVRRAAYEVKASQYRTIKVKQGAVA